MLAALSRSSDSVTEKDKKSNIYTLDGIQKSSARFLKGEKIREDRKKQTENQRLDRDSQQVVSPHRIEGSRCFTRHDRATRIRDQPCKES